MSKQRPLYRRIRDELVALILDDRLDEGVPLPSVRASAAEWDANPLTVAKGYSTLQETGIIEARPGIGFFVTGGGRARLKEAERAKFLADEWPRIARDIRRLRIDSAALLDAKKQKLR